MKCRFRLRAAPIQEFNLTNSGTRAAQAGSAPAEMLSWRQRTGAKKAVGYFEEMTRRQSGSNATCGPGGPHLRGSGCCRILGA